MPKSLDWAVGLFEGEGTILIRPRPEDQIALSLSSTDADVVEQFQKTVEFGKVYGPYCYGVNRKPFWKWNGDGASAVTFLRAALHLLGDRRKARALDAIARWEARQARPHYTVSRKGMGGCLTHKDGGAAAISGLLKARANTGPVIRDEDYPLGERVGG